MARIVTVYTSYRRKFAPRDMSLIRWLKISEALARIGHEVDMACRDTGFRAAFRPVRMAPRLRRVPLSRVNWDDYDVVKTEFHAGFETLERYGGAGHPFIISKLGSVVSSTDTPGVYFFGDIRRRLFEVQQRIAGASRFVTVLTPASRARWYEEFGDRVPTLLVPGGVDDELPERGRNPFGETAAIRCVMAGNIYDRHTQPEAHEVLVSRINVLGHLLRTRGIRLYVLGEGDAAKIDRGAATHLGSIPYECTWDYLRHADVGVVLALGRAANENESSRIYHYLRAGLPTVCEEGFPNQSLVDDAKLGWVLRGGQLPDLADAVARAAAHPWDREAAAQHMRAHHTWEQRAHLYEAAIGGPPGR